MATEAGRGIVLVGDDLDDGGEEALRQGEATAMRDGATLAAVHAVSRSRSSDDTRHALAARVEKLLGRRDVEVLVVAGKPHNIIVERARALSASTIVVGASGSLAARWLLGSTADAVVRRAEVPVLVARPSPSSHIVLVATDLSDPALAAVQAGLAEAARRKATVVLAHALDIAHPVLAAFEPSVVLDDDTRAALHAAARQTLEAQLARFGASGSVEVVEGAPQRAIPDVARRLEAELTVVATHGGLFGSTAAAIVARAPCSVLVARAPS